MTRLEMAQKLNAKFKAENRVVTDTIPTLLKMGVKSVVSDQSKTRQLSMEIAEAATFLPVKQWEVGMTTESGDIVSDPEGHYSYLFASEAPMTHANPLFYPGSVGVYYWHIIPKTKDGIKIYPDVSGIIVSVKHDELWYDVNSEHLYRWKGVDNPNCVWPPVEGNEWDLVDNP